MQRIGSWFRDVIDFHHNLSLWEVTYLHINSSCCMLAIGILRNDLEAEGAV